MFELRNAILPPSSMNAMRTPIEFLRDFASDLNRRGYRAVGLVQLGHDRPDTRQLSALLVHTGERLSLFQDLGTWAKGCRMDVGQLLRAAGRIAEEIDQGADVVIVNRFGRQEREGKGFAYLIERALSVDIPVVIAVPSHRFADWIKFVDGMSVRLHCNRLQFAGCLVECAFRPECRPDAAQRPYRLRSSEVKSLI